MYIEETGHMFNFTYEKTSDEIITKAQGKRLSLQAKVEERKERIKRLRTEYSITDEVLIDLLQQARANARSAVTQYTSNTKVSKGPGMSEESVIVPAGVVNNLMTEQDFIASETTQAGDLDLIIRNLTDAVDERRGQEGKWRGHRLSKEELIYLGF